MSITTSPTGAAVPPRQPLTLTTWLILAMATIGFACDIYVLLMLPLILPPALGELLPNAKPTDIAYWRGLMFWVPAMAGGVFGLLGGYLTDLLGRRRILTWSILLYAIASFASGYATSMTQLLVLRSLIFVGVCVEFVAAVAWLAELFPNHEQRERSLGYSQAFSSFGGLLVGSAFLLAIKLSEQLPAIVMPAFLVESLGKVGNAHAPWRYTLISGLIPAIPLILVRPFLPESPVWQKKREAGTLKRPSFAQLFSPELRQTTIISTLMVAASYGAAFGAIQQMPQIAPIMPDVKAKAGAAVKAAEAQFEGLDEKEREAAVAKVRRQAVQTTFGQLSLSQEVGGLVGRFLLAMLAVQIVSRRALIRIFQVPGLILMPLVFAVFTFQNRVLVTIGAWDVTLFHVGIFLAGLCTVAQFSFWGNYLPVAYPVHLRGTGESVAANIGGRMIGTSFAYLTSQLSLHLPGADDPTRMAYAAAGVGCFVYFAGLVLSFFLPQPKESAVED